jgi:hypothetical protein
LEIKLDSISHGHISEYSKDDDFWYIPLLFEDGLRFDDYKIFPFGAYNGLEERQCHYNSLKTYAAGKSCNIPVDICTGWAKRKEDDYWVRHSWVVNISEKTILEPTPIVRHYYYGIIIKNIDVIPKNLNVDNSGQKIEEFLNGVTCNG